MDKKSRFMLMAGKKQHGVSALFKIACIGLFGFCMTACGAGKEQEGYVMDERPVKIENTSFEEMESKGLELISLADSEEQAEEIAKLYGIELLSFSEGVAVYTTDKSFEELQELGEINGYPTLTVNNRVYELKDFNG